MWIDADLMVLTNIRGVLSEFNSRHPPSLDLVWDSRVPTATRCRRRRHRHRGLPVRKECRKAWSRVGRHTWNRRSLRPAELAQALVLVVEGPLGPVGRPPVGRC